MDFAHYWISPSERASLDQVAQRFRAAGGRWTESVSQDYEFMKRDAVMRIATGFAPGAMWLGGEDIAHIGALGLVKAMDAQATQDRWPALMHDFLLQPPRYRGTLIAQPVTLHNENWAWFNARIYRRLKLPLPTTWDEFLAQAPKLKAAGVNPLAISDQAWNVRLLFTTLVAGAGGPAIYKRLFVNEDASVLDEARMQRVLRLLAELRQWRPASGQMRTWDQATQQVIKGRAAMQVMGDWAKGEFKVVGVKPGMDYICAPVPEAGGSFIMALDMVAYPVSSQSVTEAGQGLLAKTWLDRDLQLAFARKKGSLPVRKDIRAEDLDACAADSLPRLLDASRRLSAPRLTMSEPVRTELQAALAAFWVSPQMSVEDLAQRMRRALSRRSDKS
ncbi:ABC transporter substrate-binding protein [Roseateles sp. BYS180W]|uniref:Probable sugar-binding periplasmic protein n=1 Tax=Roseateles rivi TaxID=3299028 RepID=A0ABW7FY92_9BURK